MTDTPQHIKELQLAAWLRKSPAERLRQMITDNEAIFKFWKNLKNKELTEYPCNNITDKSL